MINVPVFILGDTGSGKSTSIKELDSSKTFIFNIGNKPLPFPPSISRYSLYDKKENPNGNMLVTENYRFIHNGLDYLENNRPEIDTIVLDDTQELIINEYMNLLTKKKPKGNEIFEIYNEIAFNFWFMIKRIKSMQNVKHLYLLHHSELSENGKLQPKTVGKLLNEKLAICGSFTVVLLAVREGDKNYFYTQNDGTHPAKSPIGMFNEDKIPNDLQLINDSIDIFYEGEKNV